MSCVASRESIVYQIDTLTESVPEAVEMLAETTCSPKLLPWEIEANAANVMQEVAALEMNPQALLQELIHPAAYGGSSPLGKGLYAKPGAIGMIDDATLGDFVASEFVPGKMVLAAAGVDHDELVGLAKTSSDEAAAARTALPLTGRSPTSPLPSRASAGTRSSSCRCACSTR